ncbi:hypothetical protein RNZ50_02865 [Paracoccaceae bacterium Fryx2]|nr:hypothetical protein [Paracoccaceae bacterium Fryx2]
MRLALACLIAALPAAGFAQSELSAEIGRTGLAATGARLEALAAPGDADRFALGGVRFLGAVEAALQLRWRAGLTDPVGFLPFLRLPMAENPAPAAFEPGMIAGLFRDVSGRMDAARAPLAEVGDGSAFGLEIALGDLWFDINANGARDAGEDLVAVAGPMLGSDPAGVPPMVRFDAADAAWLSAYTHLLAGVADSVLAYDPTDATAEILQSRRALAALGPVDADPFLGRQDGLHAVDMIALILRALDQTPDAGRAAAARAHFLAMIADNRTFWSRVEAETDNAAEWLPNDRQQSALGVVLPQGTGAVWQGVLADAEALLAGQALVPYWRLANDGAGSLIPAEAQIAAGAGVNLGRMFTDPAPIDIAGWIQGVDALPYLERGRVVSAANWRAFESLVAGDAMLFTLFLN